MTQKFKVGDVVVVAPRSEIKYEILELYNGVPIKVRSILNGMIFMDEHLDWHRLNWTLVKPSKKKRFL